MNQPTVQDTLAITPSTHIIPVFKDTDFSFIQQLSPEQHAWIKRVFLAEKGEILPIHQPDSSLLLLGMGEDISYKSVQHCFRQLGCQHKSLLQDRLVLSIAHCKEVQLPLIAEAAANGLEQSTYQIGFLKSEKAEPHPLFGEQAQLHIVVGEGRQTAAVAEAAKEGYLAAQVQKRIADLVNAPANEKTPEMIASWAKKSGQQYGYDVEVLEKQEIVELGLDGLLAVNRGSEDPPRFIIAKYNCKASEAPTIGLAGKGVTFDTGGLSIKGSTNMHYMKSDMGGAGAVLGTIELVARLQLPISLVAVVPATDNSVDALSVKPGDVINSYSGKTIEIIDTDAEGRLILADALAYLVRHYKPHYLIDLATLTGSAVRAFGYECAALMSNNDSLAAELHHVGEISNERVWRLPLYSEFGEEMQSDIADIKNLSTRPMAGAITAGKFLEFFTNEHPRWAHMDIAGVAFNDKGLAKGKSATAFGVRLLTHWIKVVSKRKN